MKRLVTLAVLYIFLALPSFAAEVIKDATWSQLTIMRGLATTVQSDAVLLLAGLLAHNLKAMLV